MGVNLSAVVGTLETAIGIKPGGAPTLTTGQPAAPKPLISSSTILLVGLGIAAIIVVVAVARKK